MAKNLNMQMTITADTSQAKKEMKSLQDQLSKLGNSLDFGKGFGSGIVKEMQQAKTQVAELQAALRTATNVDTGKLDFTKFNQQLKLSGNTLKNYATTLTNLGPQGQQAFLGLSKAIAQSEIPMRRFGTLTKELGTTLANTVKWQISSSAIHTFMGAIQGAYNYAKELDKSLTNIKIVTGQSADEMAKFAEYANKTAQDLSTTTTKVTDAALIYYQQGLSDEEVKARTETTIKLANVTRQSAEEVSSQMTAIWNNFAKGSENLESYADKITALGAATASSSDEIAQGLQKFAATAETVGLSYDYATAALATVVAETRQSADVVGTAFKTLFARMESLKLEGSVTDEDGLSVSMKEYSKALDAVGVNIFDINGQLKDMDVIIDEVGSKWQTLDKNSRVALAQTVGGMRQYTQFIALMDSYDIFKGNVDIAKKAEGALEEQQHRFETGWEASTNRVKAAWEDLYNTFVDKDFFTGLNNGTASALKGISGFVDTLGGLKGVLITISPLLFNLVSDKLKTGLYDMANNLKMMLPGVRESMEGARNARVSDSLKQAQTMLGGKNTTAYKEFEEQIKYQEAMGKYGDKITDAQKMQLDYMHQQNEAAIELQKTEEKKLADLEAQARKEEIITEQKVKQSQFNYASTDKNVTSSLKTISNATSLQYIMSGGADGDLLDAPQSGLILNKLQSAGALVTNNAGQTGLTSELEEEIKQTAKEFNNLEEYAEKNGISINDAIKQLVEAYNSLSNKIREQAEKGITAEKGKIRTEIESDRDPARLAKENAINILDSNFEGEAGYKLNSRSSYASRLRHSKEVLKDYDRQIGEATSGSQKEADLITKRAALAEAISEAEKEVKRGTKEARELNDQVDKETETLTEHAEQVGQATADAKNKKGEVNVRGQNLGSTDFDRVAANMQRQKEISEAWTTTITANVQGIMALGSAMTQLSSLDNVWEEHAKGNISLWQALSRTLTTVGMLIPTFTNLAKAVQTSETATKLLRGAKKANAIASSEEAAANGAAAVSEEAKTGAEVAETVANETQTNVSRANTIQVGAEETATRGAAKAELEKAAADKVAMTSGSALTTVFKGLGTAIKNLWRSAGPAIIVIAALAAAFKAAELFEQDAAIAAESYNKELEKLKEASDKNKALQDQLNTLQELSKAYKDGNIAEQEYNTQMQSSIDSLKEENEELANKLQHLKDIGAYEQVGKVLDIEQQKAETEQSKINRDTIFTAKQAIANTGRSQQLTNQLGSITDLGRGAYSYNLAGTGSMVIGDGFGFANSLEKKFIEDIKGLGIEGVTADTDMTTLAFNPDEMSDEDFAKFLSWISKAQESGLYGNEETNDILKELNKNIPNLAEKADQVTQAIVENNKALYRAQLQKDIDTAREAGKTDTEIYNILQGFIKSGKYDFANGFENGEGEAYGKTLLTELLGTNVASTFTSTELAADINKTDTSTFTDFAAKQYGENEEAAQAYYDALSRQSEYVYNLMKHVDDGTLSLEQFDKEIVKINKGMRDAEGATEEASNNYKVVADTLDSLQFGKTFDKESKLKSFAKAFDITEQQFEKAYKDSIIAYENGTATFIGNTKKLKDELVNAKLDQKGESIKQAKDTEEQVVNTALRQGGSSVTDIKTAEDFLKQQQSDLEKLKNDKEFFTRSRDLDESGRMKITLDEFIEHLKNNYGYKGTTDQKDMEKFAQEQANNLPEYIINYLKGGTAARVKDFSSGEEWLNNFTTTEQWNSPNNPVENLEGNIKELKDIVDLYKNQNSDVNQEDFTSATTAASSVEELEYAYTKLGGSLEEYEKRMIAATSVTADSLKVKDDYEAFTEVLMENNSALAQNEALARQTALGSLQLSQGVQELHDNFDDWEKALKGDDLQKYSLAMNGLETSLQKMFNTDEDIDASFIEKNLKDIGKAAKGDVEAINNLRNAYSKSLLEGIDTFTSDEAKQYFKDNLQDIQNSLDNEEWGKLTIGMSLDDFEAGKQLEQFIIDTGMAADKAMDLLNSKGFVAEPILSDPLPFVNPVTGETEYKQTIIGFKGSSYVGTGTKPTSKKSSSKGKGKSRSKKDKKDLDDEFERYYTINRQIEKQEKFMERLSKSKDRAWGKAKLDLIDQESKALEKNIDQYEEKQKQIEKWYKNDQEKLNYFGAKYDKNGVVTNYDEMQKAEVKRYNDAVNKYNKGKLSEGGMKKAEERQKEYQEALKQYDETNKLYQENLEKLRDLRDQYFDKKLEKIEMRVEMHLEVDDHALSVIEYDLDRIKKKAFSTAEAIGEMGKQLELNRDKAKTNKKGLEDTLGLYGLDIDSIDDLSKKEIANLGLTSQTVDDLQNYMDGLMEAQKAIDEFEESILNGPLETMKEWNEEFDYQEELIENNINVLKQYQNIAELIYSNSPDVTDGFIYDMMNSQYNQMVNGVSASHAELEANKAALAEARAQYEQALTDGTNEQNLTTLRNNLREMEDIVQKSQEDMLKKTEETLKQAEDMFKKMVENAGKAFKEMTHTTDWDMTQFDRLKKLDDEYLDDYEKIYEFSKLTRDINNSIDDADTIRQKERLKEITQEIADIEASGKEVSQYEVDALRKKYELRLAEIALEDAQAAKQTVRMSRDNDGNWSYVYTADDDNVDKARQNYEDKLYEYQKLNSEFVKQQEENFLNLEKEYVEEMTKIAEDSTLSKEDKEARLQETQQYYQRMAEIMSDQLGIALNKNSELYNKDWLDYSKMTDYKISKLEDYQTKIEDTYIGVLQPNIESATDLLAQFTESTVGEDGFFPSIINALDDFNTKQEEVLNAAGTSLKGYGSTVSGVMEKTEKSSKDAASTVETSATKMKDAFDDVISKVKKLNSMNLDKLRDENEKAWKSVQKLIAQYEKLGKAQEKANNPPKSNGSSGYNSNITGGGGPGGGRNKTTKTSYSSKNSLDATKTLNLAQFLLSIGTSQSPSDIQQMTSAKNKVAVLAPLIGSNMGKASLVSWIRDTLTDKNIKEIKKDLVEGIYKNLASRLKITKNSFDTGGYTGSWGSEGRLAMLHQKELVLNAHDTENMLNTIQMVRDIVASIDTRAAAAGVMNINNAYASAATAGPQDLNQNVHIEANFPNATDHNEIELAITGLVNRASQYVGRKKL